MSYKKFKIVAETTSGKASMRIIDNISQITDSSAMSIRSYVDGFFAQGIREADVYLNSRGGDVFEAVEIGNELKRFSKVSIIVGSIAASAATYITSLFHTVAMPNSQLMIHKPMLTTAGNIDQVTADLKALEITTEDYKNTYAAKTGKTAEQIEALWAKGDYWMSAEEALREGFINSIDYSSTEQLPANQDAPQQAVEKLAALGLGLKMEALGYYSNWSIDDYLDKDPKLLAKMYKEHPQLAETLQRQHFGQKPTTITQVESALINSIEANWTLEDYLDKNPDAYRRMQKENPARAKMLETAYFNKR